MTEPIDSLAVQKDGVPCMPLKDIKLPLDKNTLRDPQAMEDHVNRLEGSIVDRGWLPDKPIVVTDSGQLIDGHCRIAALRQAIKRGAISLPIDPENKESIEPENFPVPYKILERKIDPTDFSVSYDV